jgi:hypothetical protein
MHFCQVVEDQEPFGSLQHRQHKPVFLYSNEQEGVHTWLSSLIRHLKDLKDCLEGEGGGIAAKSLRLEV